MAALMMNVPPPTGYAEIYFSASDALGAWERATQQGAVEGWSYTGQWEGYPSPLDEEEFFT